MEGSAVRIRSNLLTSALIQSCKQNIRAVAAGIGMFSFTEQWNQTDPLGVNSVSSLFFQNIISIQTKLGTPYLLSNDAISSLIQILRHLYSENGHTVPYHVENHNVAVGELLVLITDVDQLPKGHIVHLAMYGETSLKARPIIAVIFCDNAEKFWFVNHGGTDVCDIQLHSIIVLGLNI